jgi:hypothetical protein
MMFTAWLAAAVIQQQDPGWADLPEASQKTAAKELGDNPKAKVKKEKDGTFTVSTKTVRLSLTESGDLLSKEEDVAADQLPKEVQETAKKELGEATLKAKKLSAKEKVTFEVKGDESTLVIGEDGLLASKEEKIKPENLPQAVIDAVQAKFQGATISKAKKVTIDGKTVIEVSLKLADKGKAKAKFTEDGKEVPAQ